MVNVVVAFERADQEVRAAAQSQRNREEAVREELGLHVLTPLAQATMMNPFSIALATMPR